MRMILNDMLLPYLIALIVQFLIIGYLSYLTLKKRKTKILFGLFTVAFIFTLTLISYKANYHCYSGEKLIKKGYYSDGLVHLKKCHNVRSYFHYLEYMPYFYLTEKKELLSLIGIASYENKNYKDAILYLSSTLSIDPNQFIPRAYLAHSYFLTEQYKEAEKNYLILIKLDGSISFIRSYHLGLSYMHLGSFDKAILEFKSAIQIEPERKDINFLIASCYAALKDTSNAIKNLNEAITFDRKFLEVALKDSNFNYMKSEIIKLKQ